MIRVTVAIVRLAAASRLSEGLDYVLVAGVIESGELRNAQPGRVQLHSATSE